MTYNISQDIKYVRILIADTDDEQLFSNAEIAVFLEREPNPKLAAASLLDAIAVNEVRLAKVIRTQDLSTDGSKVADSLRKQAYMLRQQADEEDGGSRYFAFEIADMQPTAAPELTEPSVWGL